MLKTKEKGNLLAIIEHCSDIETITLGLSREKFDNDKVTRAALCFFILQIGELVNHLDADFGTKYCGVPWNKIVGMRNKVVHGYASIDNETVWKTSIEDIAPLHEYCLKILEENK